MKNYLAALVLVLLGMSAHAQNLTMSDLTNLAELGNTEAHNNLTFEKPFKQLYTQVIKGLTISHYQGTTPSSKSEMVIIGYGVKNGEGTFLHSVTYTSTNVKYIRNLLAQGYQPYLLSDGSVLVFAQDQRAFSGGLAFSF